MSDYDHFLQELNQQEWFTQFRNEVLLKQLPIPREYDGSEESVTRWKQDCAEKAGYEKCLAYLGIYLS